MSRERLRRHASATKDEPAAAARRPRLAATPAGLSAREKVQKARALEQRRRDHLRDLVLEAKKARETSARPATVSLCLSPVRSYLAARSASRRGGQVFGMRWPRWAHCSDCIAVPARLVGFDKKGIVLHLDERVSFVYVRCDSTAQHPGYERVKAQLPAGKVRVPWEQNGSLDLRSVLPDDSGNLMCHGDTLVAYCARTAFLDEHIVVGDVAGLIVEYLA